MAPFAQVARALGYYIEGRTNGSAAMKSVLRGGEVTADILLDSVEVKRHSRAADASHLALGFRPQPRRGDGRRPRQTRHAYPRFLRPDRNRYFARLDVDSLDMALLDPILAGVVSSTEGVASADLTLQGQGRKAELEGRNPRRGTENHGRFHAGDLLDARGRTEREEQPVQGFERPDFRSPGQPWTVRFRHEPPAPFEYLLRRARGPASRCWCSTPAPTTTTRSTAGLRHGAARFRATRGR